LPLLLIIGALFLAACNSAAPHEFGGAALEPPLHVPDFTLDAAGDQSVSLSDFRGQYVYLYFGYTFCPDACPTTLSKLAKLRDELGEDGDTMQVIMVTVDPERDTPEALADYVTRFDPSFIGLAGDKLDIDAIGQPFGLYYQRHEGTTSGGYLVDHTTRTYLINPEGNALVAYPHDAPVESMLEDLRWLLQNES
jgi:protein SCO1/2